jgi:hypothetical protein
MNKGRVFSCLVAGFLIVSACASCAQTNLSLGSIGPVTAEQCPANKNFATGMNCFNTTISGCQGTTTNITVDFGYVPVNAPQGVIVLFSGGAGESPSPELENRFVSDYVTAGYEPFEVAWESPWEATAGTSGDNIMYAACWPATLLNYFYQYYLVNMRQPPPGGNNPHAGMCAQGFSGGSAALAYALAWYGAYSYVDKAALLSGPVFSDIEQGCIVPAAPNKIVCDGSPSWCKLGTQAPWSDAPAYQDPVTSGVRLWSGPDPTCAYPPTSNYQTSSQSNQNWLNMSIVNQSGGTFSYPNTNVTGWLCASVYQNAQQMNNSSAQGQIFNAAVAAAEGSNLKLTVYAVQNCDDPEGVQTRDAVVPALASLCQPGNYCGYTAIMNDMTNQQNNPTYCHH